MKQAATLEDVQLEGLSSAVVSVSQYSINYFLHTLIAQTFKKKIDGIKATEETKLLRLEDRLPKTLVDSLMGFQREGVR